MGISSGRKAPTVGTSVVIDPKDLTNTVNLATLDLLNPQTKSQFEQLRLTLGPIIANNSKKAHYGLFLEEFVKELAKELSSDQIKKVSSALTRLGNEKMKEEKAAEKGGKKTKAAKTKTSLVASRPNTTDIATYDDDAFGEYVEAPDLDRPLASHADACLATTLCEAVNAWGMQLGYLAALCLAIPPRYGTTVVSSSVPSYRPLKLPNKQIVSCCVRTAASVYAPTTSRLDLVATDSARPFRPRETEADGIEALGDL